MVTQMSKTVVVLQSNYIPWKGYFDLVHDADEFIFYDDVQFTKNDWRNRNKVKTPRGAEWMTIPVKGGGGQLIYQVAISDATWQQKHFKTLHNQYGKSPYFSRYTEFLEEIYVRRNWTNLSELNQYLIRSIAHDLLGIGTKFRDSREFSLTGNKQDRLLELLTATGATRYVSGPSAKDYIDPACFAAKGIDLVWKDYSGYPEYPQRHPPFEHGVTIFDLLFNVGPQAPWYIWGWRES